MLNSLVPRLFQYFCVMASKLYVLLSRLDSTDAISVTVHGQLLLVCITHKLASPEVYQTMSCCSAPLFTFQNFISISMSFRLIRDAILMEVDWEQHSTELDRIFFKSQAGCALAMSA